MSSQLLKLYIQVGQFLAITPPSVNNKENTNFRNIHQIFITLIIIVGVLVSVYHRNFYQEYNLPKITVCLLTDFVLALFTCRIIVEARRVGKLGELIENLKKTSNLLEENESQEKNVLWKFILPQCIFWLVVIYTQIVWFLILGSLHLKQYGFETVEVYIQFFYSFYISTILEMIWRRYQALRQLFETSYIKNETNLARLNYFACSLKEITINFNENFGWSFTLLIAYTTLQFLNYLEYNLQSQYYGGKNLTHVIITQVLAILISFVPTLMMILKCDKILEESQKILFLVCQALSKCNDLQEREELDRFCNILVLNLPEFSAARFFSIGRWTILSIFGTVATFFIVLVTFDPKVKTPFISIGNFSQT